MQHLYTCNGYKLVGFICWNVTWVCAFCMAAVWFCWHKEGWRMSKHLTTHIQFCCLKMAVKWPTGRENYPALLVEIQRKVWSQSGVSRLAAIYCLAVVWTFYNQKPNTAGKRCNVSLKLASFVATIWLEKVQMVPKMTNLNNEYLLSTVVSIHRVLSI